LFYTCNTSLIVLCNALQLDRAELDGKNMGR
jgi:hypothetical protein